MKEKRKESYSTGKHKKSKKKYDKSSSDSNSSDEWVEATSVTIDTKTKKKKKHKKRKYKSSSSSDSESSSKEYSNSESFVQETESSASTSTQKRDNWMNEESFVPTLSKDEMYSSARQKKMNLMKEQRDKLEKIQRERELNPHLKNEGPGLPEKAADVKSLSLPSTSVGDGGYSYLKKAYYRIQEQAQQEGRSMAEIAVERWGSLDKLISLIEEAEERMKNHPDFKNIKSSYKDKYEDRNSKSRFKRPSDTFNPERTYKSEFQFKKPSQDSRKHKDLNKFKSSRSSNYSNYNEINDEKEYEKSHCSKYAYEEKSLMREGQSRTHKESDNSNGENRHVPAWKKQKGPVNEPKQKETFNSPECASSDMSVKDSSNIHSHYDLCQLAAEQLRAELMGDSALSEKLTKQLEEARKIVEERGYTKKRKEVEEVVLTKLDSHGQARPLQTSQHMVENYKRKKTGKYFDDGSSLSLKQMFEREKLTTTSDHMEMFVEASAHGNDADEIDNESGYISKKLHKKLSSTREDERDIGKAIQQHQKLTATLERCTYCLDQPRNKKDLIIDIGEHVYLSLPTFQTLTEGHCLIVPKSHISSFLSLEENEWKELKDFKNQLRIMFRSQDKSVIFLETSMNFRHFPHAIIECIPVPKEEGDMAPFYFKKAIQESEYEWAHNKKLIDLKNKGLRHSVPKNLPYFYVEFDPEVHAGYAHVIEEEKHFPRNFGKEVVGGMLDIDYNYLYKNKKDDPLKKSEAAAKFGKLWQTFKDIV